MCYSRSQSEQGASLCHSKNTISFFFLSFFHKNLNFSFCFLCIAVYHVSHVPSLNDCTGLSQMQPQSLHEGFKEVSRKASESRFGVQENQHQKYLRKIKSTVNENKKTCKIHCTKCVMQLTASPYTNANLGTTCVAKL